MRKIYYIVRTIVSLLFVSNVLNSCGNLGDQIECFNVSGVYAISDISLFKGFFDKNTIETTKLSHGNPDKVFDSSEPTTVDGYMIHEYSFEDGAIDCYVSHDSQKGVIEYVYYEPKKNIPLSNFIKDENVQNDIKNSGGNVIFLRDETGQYLRLRLNKDNLQEISNMSLGDITQIVEQSRVQQIVDEFSSPIGLSDFGQLTNIKKNDNEVCFCINVEESEKTINDFGNEEEIAEVISSFLFCAGFAFPFVYNDIINNNINLSYELKGNKSNQERICKIDANRFKELYINADNEYILNQFVKFENYTLPSIMNDWLVFGKRVIEGNCLHIYNWVKLTEENRNWSEDDFRLYIKQLFTDKDNPEIKYLNLCYKCNKNIEFVYVDKELDIEYKTLFTVDEISKMLKSIH